MNNVMGSVEQKATVENSFDRLKVAEGTRQDVRQMEIKFLVDTGSSRVALPTRMINELGLARLEAKEFQTANGAAMRYFYSPIVVRIGDRDATVEVIEIPDEVKAPPLLGYLALEALELMVDTKNHCLTPTPQTRDKFVLDLF